MSEHQDTRKSWDAYFLDITRAVATRSTCPRAAVGAIIVKDRNILATGYNGAPSGQPHCAEVGCLIFKSENPFGETEINCYRTIHAEMNALIQAAKHGARIEGADFYVTHSPCYHCLKSILNAGVRRVYYAKPYKLHTVESLLAGTDVTLVHVPGAEGA
ncbi:MAG: cytidine/deoxycytidylate deaminase family protein [Myxococcales bacterium]|nr:cytidine/deoxycytidylate deaminase family protein [Myxococcales bacterium]